MRQWVGNWLHILGLGLVVLATEPTFVPAATPVEIQRSADDRESKTSSRRVAWRALERSARKVEPSLAGQHAKLPLYLEFFRQQWTNDARLFAWDVMASRTAENGLRLEGFVEFPETAEALAAYLEILGFQPVEDRLQRLPAAELGADRFGLVQVTHSLSYDRPEGARQVVTDYLLGETLFLLREERGQLLVHGAEGYLGYLPAQDVLRLEEVAFAEHCAAPTVRLRKDHVLPAGTLLPAGCRLRWVGDEADRVVVRLPTGETVGLPTSCCDSPPHAAPPIDRVIGAAQQFFGTPYLWGGKSSRGIDCSGLVQVAFAAAGIPFPRDSNQQIYLGKLSATRWCRSTMCRGDTLYFLGPQGKIRHTAIYLGNDRYLHAESPVVRISSFHPHDADYDAGRDAAFAFAKRLFD